jgi:very-short-patch-repair endonuclease
MAKVRSVRSAILLARARRMRREPTGAEAKLWSALRGQRLGGWKWRRQAPFGAFIVDFLCEEARLIVEVDGDVHVGQVVYDEDRAEYLRRFGFRVLRFTNEAVLADVSGVCAEVVRACGGERGSGSLSAAVSASAPPSPCPLPVGEGF